MIFTLDKMHPLAVTMLALKCMAGSRISDPIGTTGASILSVRCTITTKTTCSPATHLVLLH